MTDEETIRRLHDGQGATRPETPYTPDSLADRWKVSRETIRQMIHRGDLPAFRIGRLFRIPPDAVEDFERQATNREG